MYIKKSGAKPRSPDGHDESDAPATGHDRNVDRQPQHG
jgi:hypothetical protein